VLDYWCPSSEECLQWAGLIVRLDLMTRSPDAPGEGIRNYGFWRTSGAIGDLRRHLMNFRISFPAHRSTTASRLTSYGEYAGHFERFAGALVELYVRAGDVVALQLPNWWQSTAVMLTAALVGAVLSPIPTSSHSFPRARCTKWLLRHDAYAFCGVETSGVSAGGAREL
jgi:hypothetical protein